MEQGFTLEVEGPNAGGRYGWTAFFRIGEARRQVAQSTDSYEDSVEAREEGEKAVAAAVAHLFKTSRSEPVRNGTVVGHKITQVPRTSKGTYA